MLIDGIPIEAWKGKLHDTTAAARYLGLKPQTLAIWRCKSSDGPRFRKIGSRVAYLGADIIDWVDGRARRSTSSGTQTDG